MSQQVKSLPRFDGNLAIRGVLAQDPFVSARKDGTGYVVNVIVKVSAIKKRANPVLVPFVVFDQTLAMFIAENYRKNDLFLVTKSYPISTRGPRSMNFIDYKLKFIVREIAIPDSNDYLAAEE